MAPPASRRLVVVLSDGGEDFGWACKLAAAKERILDWFHIGMRFQHLLIAVQGLRGASPRMRSALTSMVTLIEAENSNSRAPWRRKRSGQLPNQGSIKRRVIGLSGCFGTASATNACSAWGDRSRHWFIAAGAMRCAQRAIHIRNLASPRRPTARLPVARIQPRFLAGPQHHLLTWLADLADLNTTAFRRPTWSSANPGKLNYGSSGASMVTLIEAENFNSRAAWRRKRSGQLPDQG